MLVTAGWLSWSLLLRGGLVSLAVALVAAVAVVGAVLAVCGGREGWAFGATAGAARRGGGVGHRCELSA